ncbi:hypothetical protein VP01_2722g2 [Puccinia sorghi]|uniref:Uncharacterized protein n=1 Tax=Puccinia sorghi TaxID=27349 RepID=A0A0L6V554_9BASI|nr:hypothetical protein VP01_2722g2 [Puccinia sorghi]
MLIHCKKILESLKLWVQIPLRSTNDHSIFYDHMLFSKHIYAFIINYKYGNPWKIQRFTCISLIIFFHNKSKYLQITWNDQFTDIQCASKLNITIYLKYLIALELPKVRKIYLIALEIPKVVEISHFLGYPVWSLFECRNEAVSHSSGKYGGSRQNLMQQNLNFVSCVRAVTVVSTLEMDIRDVGSIPTGHIFFSEFHKNHSRQNICSLFPGCSVQRAVIRECLLLDSKKDTHLSRCFSCSETKSAINTHRRAQLPTETWSIGLIEILGCGLDDTEADNITKLDGEIISRIRELTPNDIKLTHWIDFLWTPKGNHSSYTDASFFWPNHFSYLFRGLGSRPP